MRHNIKISAVILFLLLVINAGCGGGGGGGTTEYGGTSGYVYFDSLPTSVSNVSTAAQSKHNFKVAKLLTHSNRPKAIATERVVKFKTDLSQAKVQEIIAGLGGTIKRKVYGSNNTYLIAVNTQTLSNQSFQNHPGVLFSEENQLLYATATPNDAYYSTDQVWNYGLLRMPQAWDIAIGNNNIIVAVIDTGVTPSHPDLAANLVPGYDFVDGDSTPWDTTWFDINNRYSHGSHVAGIISAVTNNSTGVAGVAWNVKIMPIRVLGNDGSGTSANIAAGINWAATHGAHIINMSLGGAYPASAGSQAVKDAIDAAIAAGVTVIAAAGNEGANLVDFPANYSPVIAVAAIGPDSSYTSYSNYGPEIFVCAPGGVDASPPSSNYVLSTSYDKLSPSDCYVWMTGTSMATPHISGLAALLYTRGIANHEAIRERLQSYSTDLGSLGWDSHYGYGLPRADEVLNGSVPDIRSVKVFWGNIDGTILGAPVNPNGFGYYSLSNIPTGQRYVCAFLDRNMDGLVGFGDKFAYVIVTVQANIILPNTDITIIQQVNVTNPIPLAQYVKTFFASK